VLLAGAGNCAGNLRIKEAAQFNEVESIGFQKEEIWKKKTKVLNELEKVGIAIGSSSSVQGDSPKFFLAEDLSGQWHPSGVLHPSKIKKEWLVKFPRSSKDSDRLVLQMEDRYHHIAKKFGLNTFETLNWKEDVLFVPRFDVQVESGSVHRFGLESMASSMGIAEFGARPSHENYLSTIKRFSTNPEVDIKEYLSRDILNVCFGNTDNHPRNTAFIKTPTSCRLSPIYDFAPMVLDSEGITRVCRWSKDREIASEPQWKKIKTYLISEYGDLEIDWNLFFKEKGSQLEEINDVLNELNLQNELMDYCRNQILLQIKGLL
jgi:serine/threonine-protein kinase HipA